MIVQNKKEYEYCKRCGRKLKTAEARARGYGPICAKKIETPKTNRLFKG